MNSLLLMFVLFLGYIIAYHIYGRFLGRRIFKISKDNVSPSITLRDEKDYVPTKRGVLFGHHFTSISGLGPIVGPAIAVIWGWLPAVLWVFLGSIFMGAVHDFGTLVLSLRGEGKSIGGIAKNVINHRVHTLFLLIIFFSLWIVLAIFALIIAILFTMYPQTIIPVWFEIPIAVYLGFLVFKKGYNAHKLGVLAVIIMYITIIAGAYLPIEIPQLMGLSPVVLWIIVLFIYTYLASTLPVQILLQPRDYINSHQLMIAMGLLIIGTFIAHPPIVAPAINPEPIGAPPVFPFIFVVIACGAISGFHCLVSSGTTSKQCDNETNALFIGYGSMLLEAALATLVIVAVTAGLGMGLTDKNGEILTGLSTFTTHYASWAAASGLSAKLGAFVTGSANLISSFGIPSNIAVSIMGVFIVSFAATTLDSATRIQRYVISEIALSYNMKTAARRHPATLIAVSTALLLAFSNKTGKGALILWPLFGSVNQLLAGLALLVVTIYLARKKTPVVYTLIPMCFMLFMTGWAMLFNLKNFFNSSNWLLFSIGLAIFILEIWMVVESIIILKRFYFSKNIEELQVVT